MNLSTHLHFPLMSIYAAIITFLSFNTEVLADQFISQAEPSLNQDVYLEDHCVGGTANELLAQANVVTAKRYPEYGLSDSLAISCPKFVWIILQADSLSAEEKKRTFADFMKWGLDERERFFHSLKRSVEKNAEEYWQQNNYKK